jgi:hypothetical protein
VPLGLTRSLNGVTASTPPAPTCRNVSAGEPRHVVHSRVLLDEPHARGHLTQMPERRASVLADTERRHVLGRGIIHRADVAFRDRDADQHGGDGLGHRPRGEAMPIVSPYW